MRTKFVQFVSIILAIIMLSGLYASAAEGISTNTEAEEGQIIENGQSDIEIDVSDDGTNTDSEVSNENEEATDSEQGSTDTDTAETTEPVEPLEPEVPEVIVPVVQTEEEPEELLRVGLNFDSNVLTSANLLNSVGSGYRFGYHDGNVFYQVGYTDRTGISILKTQNLYYTSIMPDGYPGYGATETSGPAVGCIHLQLPGTYATFDEAKAAAGSVGGFPAWINGEFVVRYGVFLTSDAAAHAQTANNMTDSTIVGTSEYGFTVVETGTNTALFQFDGGSNQSMFVVKPGLNVEVKSTTHYKGVKYYGYFRFQRIDGEDFTVVNLINFDDYVRGVIPYEMSPSWPLEALKAQAVAARSYAIALSNSSHNRSGFDVCTSECCQVYYGTGGATEHTDRAVDETAGQYAWYDDEIILAVFHSSDGGATESCENVWFQALPYLRGVVDPYEALVADKINSYNWTKTFTGAELQEKLNGKGYQCTEIVDVKLKYTDVGNVYSITFVDTNGKNWTISKDSLRVTFGFRSLHFSLVDDLDDYVLSDQSTLGSLQGVWTLNGNGQLVQININPVYAMTSEGIVEVPGSKLSGKSFVFSGAGRGHNLGLSQWGAYSMAHQGYTYDQILKFYYTGIEIHE